jgi:hypothetical protein
MDRTKEGKAEAEAEAVPPRRERIDSAAGVALLLDLDRDCRLLQRVHAMDSRQNESLKCRFVR